MNFATRIIAASALAFGFMGAANATAMIDQSDESNNQFLGVYSVGQSFTAGLTGKLTAISFQSYYGWGAGASVGSVYAGDTLDSGSLLATGTFTAAFSSGMISYDISSLDVFVAAGSQYTVNFEGTGAYYAIGTDLSGGYAGGQAYYFNAPRPNLDAAFRTYVDTDAVAPSVPEPATWALTICGFGMVGSAVRRKRRVNVSFG